VECSEAAEVVEEPHLEAIEVVAAEVVLAVLQINQEVQQANSHQLINEGY
jgi:hypothetical protein